MCIVSRGFRPKPRPKDFSGKVLWNLKSFCQNKVVCSAGNSLAYLSYKKGKLWLPPQTPTKGLFVKSPLETQKLHQNKLVCSVRSSLTYLSFKKGKSVGNSFAYFSYKKSRSRKGSVYHVDKIGDSAVFTMADLFLANRFYSVCCIFGTNGDVCRF